MAKRVKPILNIPAVTTLEEADATLAQIAARKRELALRECPAYTLLYQFFPKDTGKSKVK